METPRYRQTFHSIYEWCGTDFCRNLNGKPFQIVQYVTEPNEYFDEEVLPMYIIDIEGQFVTAFVEEVEERERV